MVGKGIHFKLFCEGKTCCKTQGCGSDPANVMYKSSIATSGYFSIIKYHSLATRARSPQQHELITAGPYYLSHPVNFPCGRKPEYRYPEKTHDFQSTLTVLWCRLVTMLLACINILFNILGFKGDTTLQSDVYERLIIW